MKGKAVSAFRDEYGLRRMSAADPPVVGRPAETTNKWKVNIMKTLILRPAKPVEPQKINQIAPMLPGRRESAGTLAPPGSYIQRSAFGLNMNGPFPL